MTSPVFPVCEEDLHLVIPDILSPPPAANRPVGSFEEPRLLIGFQRQQLPRGPSEDRRSRTKFSPQQVSALEAAFDKNPYPPFEERAALAAELRLQEGRVQQWFQNRRAKARRIAKARQQIPDPPTRDPSNAAPLDPPPPSEAGCSWALPQAAQAPASIPFSQQMWMR